MPNAWYLESEESFFGKNKKIVYKKNVKPEKYTKVVICVEIFYVNKLYKLW